MKWEMEVEEIEAVLEKIWDLHDKLSDAIHSISRAHFLNSIKSLKNSDDVLPPRKKKPSFNEVTDENNEGAGFVFVKNVRVDDDDYSAIHEAKSLNSIRTALENLEDQLEFFHTVQLQQRAERDAAIARLEQSRIVLAMRLAEHQGKKYKVIEEALDFVGDVREAGRFVSPDNLYGSALCPPGEKLVRHEARGWGNLIRLLLKSFNFAKKSFKLDEIGAVAGNAALLAISTLALMHVHQASCKDKCISEFPQDAVYNRNVRKDSQLEGSCSGRLTNLDVMLARG